MSALAQQYGITRWSTDLDKALLNPDDEIFFDAGTTQMRPMLLEKAIRAGKHVYCEKPIATNLEEAVAVVKLANAKGLKHGTVQDKLFLPGLKKLAFLRDSGFFGRILSVRGEFGYWVFEGDWGQPAQRRDPACDPVRQEGRKQEQAEGQHKAVDGVDEDVGGHRRAEFRAAPASVARMRELEAAGKVRQ